MEVNNNMEHLLEKARKLKFKSIEPTIKELFKQATQESWIFLNWKLTCGYRSRY